MCFFQLGILAFLSYQTNGLYRIESLHIAVISDWNLLIKVDYRNQFSGCVMLCVLPLALLQMCGVI